jgi:enamine deaminase RidA (YjgF/YER057c/UK114 family)
VVTTSAATEIFARCAPIASANSRNGSSVQSQVLYNGLATLLEQLGAEMGHVVIEKAYFRNLAADYDDFQQVRTEAYGKLGITGDRLPATTYLGQPPCRSGEDVELQAYALVPASPETARVRSLPSPQEDVQVKRIDLGEARQLYISNITGRDEAGNPLGTFRRQSDAIFEEALKIVNRQGIPFTDVLRTWIYLDDIDRDYDELNASRNAFFQREQVQRMPASTGIGGGSHPKGTLCTVDVHALLNPEIAGVEVMTTPTLNEAPEYGSSFSRGMKMALPEETYLFISGTASVDEEGATVHVGDVRAQIERMLLNVEELLKGQGATFADLTHAVTYLKSAADFELYQRICAERGVKDVPHTIVEANVCRPELLCEMEAIAVVPTD